MQGRRLQTRRSAIGKARVLGVLAVALTSLLFPLAVMAHARYQRSEPGAGAIVAEPPTRVDIWFTQELFRREGDYGIEVTGPDGSPTHAGPAVIDDKDRSHMSVHLKRDLPVGEYLVQWWNISAEDGDEAEGSFSFLYNPAAAVTSSPMPGPSDTPAPVPTVTAFDSRDEPDGRP